MRRKIEIRRAGKVDWEDVKNNRTFKATFWKEPAYSDIDELSNGLFEVETERHKEETAEFGDWAGQFTGGIFWEDFGEMGQGDAEPDWDFEAVVQSWFCDFFKIQFSCSGLGREIEGGFWKSELCNRIWNRIWLFCVV